MSLLQVLLFASCIQALLLAGYFFFYSSLRGIRLFGLLLIVMALHLYLVANDNQAFFLRFPHLLHITWVIPALYGPLILIFVRRITRLGAHFSKVEVIYFLPFLLLVTYHFPFFMSSASAKSLYIADFERSVVDDFGLINQAVAWLHVAYFGIALWYLKAYQLKILDFAANEEARLLWLGYFLRFALIVVAIGILAFYSKKFDWPMLRHLYPYHFLGLLALIYWCAFCLIRQPVIFQSPDEEDLFISNQKAPGKSKVQETNVELAEQLKHLMEEEKLYKTPGLTLADLATLLQTNKQYISETINQTFGKNFYDFVNEYRLQEFLFLSDNPDYHHLKLLGLAYEAGFNSKATFNAVFKKHYETTPSNYLRSKVVEKESELINSDDLK